ncbi:hypothetical protein ISTM_466 [Insectomime virus]|uniref:Uncharacterized protein n=1 Tax=Tunisvirus fontaine2 TaxID=1421067 RepID=V9SH04_9VIRU|nr:hypothetical protein D1R32_gp335 [Tunisvirus fontaine2]AHA46364.1 hypothetical protein ISTM_466 [Insectomime virus]AHC55052.1 hypothetical protein TNS_ORF334 [Tunisvirus fontaine2]
MEENLKSYISQKFRIDKSRLFVKRVNALTASGEECWKTLFFDGHVLCCWTEYVEKETGKLLFYDCDDNDHSGNPPFLFLGQSPNYPLLLGELIQTLEKENERLTERVEKLREKNRKLKYAPGEKGALGAQTHFESLQ